MKFTRSGVLVNEKRNVFFDNMLDAYRYAAQKRSYPYQVFDRKGNHDGYAVPQ